MGDKIHQKQISLLTFNTLGTPIFAPDIQKRYRKVAEHINTGEYDVVCLQEILTYYNLSLFRRFLTRFPYICYEKSIIGPKGGLVIFSKFPLIHKEYVTYSYPTNARVPFYTKIVQNGVLTCTIQPFSLRLCATHLSSDTVHNLFPEHKFYKLIRNQMLEAAVAVNHYAKRGESVIIVGDFNIAKHSQLYREFLKNSNAIDIFASEDQPTYYPDRIPYIYPAIAPNRIDYMFLSSNAKVRIRKTEHLFQEKETLSNHKKGYLSDHISLHCTLEVIEK